MSNFVGQEIEGYKIHKPIGEGKFSTVYKAENAQGKVIALKKIKIFDMMDPKQRDKCLKEVKLMQPLDHPNIIKYLDSFIYNNELIIATEWAEKGDLKRLIKNAMQDDTPFLEIKIWDYIKQVSSALQHMHEKRIMHRDLKPANIFIGSDGTLKIGDLGLGRIFSSETIEAYSKVGTPLYMSPELLHGEGYDMKSDVWSLGCIAYELCEFKSPFRNENEKMSLMDLFNNITKGDFKPISTRYSGELRDLISSMVVLDPAKRADSASVYTKSSEVLRVLQDKQRTPQIYCILVMEDIYEKLALVDYHTHFCAILKRPPVHKFYFALDDRSLPLQEQETKFFYFAELCYWLMNLPNNNKQVASQLIKKNLSYKSVEEAAKRLLQDIRTWGIKLPDQMNWVHINTGAGDTVCFILNDLLNRELIRLNFKFESPEFQGIIKQENEQIDLPIQEEEEDKIPDQQSSEYDSDNEEKEDNQFEGDYLTQSVIIYNKKIQAQDNVDQGKLQINGTVPIEEWQKECQRVDKELTRFEFQMKVNGKETYLKDFEKSHRQVKKSKKLYQQAIEYFKSQNVTSYLDELEDIVQRIPLLEQRLQETIDLSQIEQLQKNKQQITSLKLEIEQKNIYIDALTHQDKLLEGCIQEKHDSIEINQRNPTDTKSKIKQLISTLKNDIKQLDIRIGLTHMQVNNQIKYFAQFKMNRDITEEPISDTEDLIQ